MSTAFEVDDANVFGECLAAEGIGLADDGHGIAFLEGADDPFRRRADDGFVGVPSLCSGLWRLAQVCAAHGPVGDCSLIHQTVGRAAQGHAVTIVRRVGEETT